MTGRNNLGGPPIEYESNKISTTKEVRKNDAFARKTNSVEALSGKRDNGKRQTTQGQSFEAGKPVNSAKKSLSGRSRSADCKKPHTKTSTVKDSLSNTKTDSIGKRSASEDRSRKNPSAIALVSSA